MKVIIAGSRDFDDYAFLLQNVEQSGFEITEVVSGCARGADKLGEVYADQHNIPIKRFPADWQRYGKRAGIYRNIDMANYGDALIALWNGESLGTHHMINMAKATGLIVHIGKYSK